jgi:hypothetical protein
VQLFLFSNLRLQLTISSSHLLVLGLQFLDAVEARLAFVFFPIQLLQSLAQGLCKFLVLILGGVGEDADLLLSLVSLLSELSLDLLTLLSHLGLLGLDSLKLGL